MDQPFHLDLHKKWAAIFIVLFTFGLMLWGQGCKRARSKVPVEYWESIVREDSLKTIAHQLSDASLPSWPPIISTYAAQQLPDKKKQDALKNIQLAWDMREKMCADFKPDTMRNQEQVEEDVTLYSSVAEPLYRFGGYNNLLLADTALRMAIYRASGWVVVHPEDTTESEKLVSMLTVPRVNVKELLGAMSDQDADLDVRRNKIIGIGANDDLYKSYAVIGTGLEFMFPPQAEYTGSLLKEPSVTKLVFRMAETEYMVNASLKGTIRFFQLGGQYAELDPRDIRPFVQRMGQEAKVYRYPLLQKRQFTENEILYLIAIHKEPAVRDAWLNMILK